MIRCACAQAAQVEPLRAEHNRLQQLANHASDVRRENARLSQLVGEVPQLEEELAAMQAVHAQKERVLQQLEAEVRAGGGGGRVALLPRMRCTAVMHVHQPHGVAAPCITSCSLPLQAAEGQRLHERVARLSAEAQVCVSVPLRTTHASNAAGRMPLPHICHSAWPST